MGETGKTATKFVYEVVLDEDMTTIRIFSTKEKAFEWSKSYTRSKHELTKKDIEVFVCETPIDEEIIDWEFGHSIATFKNGVIN